MVAQKTEHTIQDHIEAVAAFTQKDIRGTIAGIEASIRGIEQQSLQSFLGQCHVNPDLLTAAAEVKRASSQIDVTIHALGILSALPHILLPGEVVESVSLGAGNTGRAFDLETSNRVAEFKFITWRGGAESIRQNSIFKDFLDLATAETPKEKYLYLLGTEHALKFLRGGRAMSSVLSKNETTSEKFNRLFGNRYQKVGQFFADYQHAVKIVDVSPFVPELIAIKSMEDVQSADL